MAKNGLPVRGDVSFEEIRKINEHGAEYWSARDLQPLLGYSQWRRFEDAIKRAVVSCEQSGNIPKNHFADAGKMVDLGSGSIRNINNYHLSRFACYLIAQNGDPRKPEIANAQQYFAIQARRQEVSDALAAGSIRRPGGRPGTVGNPQTNLRRIQGPFRSCARSRGSEPHVRGLS